MKIKLPSIDEQKKIVFEESTKENIKILKDNLKAKRHICDFNEKSYSKDHYEYNIKSWEPPHHEIVFAFFEHFKSVTEYKTDTKLALLLGVSNDRIIRKYKKGDTIVPYHVWRKFLVISGRVPQEILKVEIYAF